ncbi:hypothetical protein M885DRAFT_516600 [Pelagophyceae sp. CCMP2097]|nr:hypothetical protein M885DRAFT_516600 [Pelagophyceae sp. CCMP2097]
MTAADISAYTEELVRSGRLELEGVPPQLRGVERFVYAHCVKILLCLMHDSLDCLATGDECNGTVFGLGVVLEQTARNNVDLLGSLRERLRGEKSDIRIDTASVADFIDAIVQVENEARYGNGSATSSSFTASVERLLYKNVSNIVLNLIADACATFRFDIFGHSISLKLAPDKALSLSKMSLDDVRKRRRTLATRPRIFDEELINALTDEILSDKDINMWFVPDELEMSFYRRFFTFYGVVLDYVLSDIRLASLDVDATISLHRVASLSASRAASRAKNKT